MIAVFCTIFYVLTSSFVGLCTCIYLHACGRVKEMFPLLAAHRLCGPADIYAFKSECLSLFEAHDKIHALFKTVPLLQPTGGRGFTVTLRTDVMLCLRQL